MTRLTITLKLTTTMKGILLFVCAVVCAHQLLHALSPEFFEMSTMEEAILPPELARHQRQQQQRAAAANNRKGNNKRRAGDVSTSTFTSITGQDIPHRTASLPAYQTYNATASSELAPPTTHTAACLIIMDDNHWLIEWLAYHYFAANLRNLIVVRDPRSVTTPAAIVQRYHHKHMNITMWLDQDFLPNFIMREQKKGQLWRHLNRQQAFYAKCMQHFKRQGRKHSYLLLIDTDEFVTIDPAVPGYQESWLQQPGHLVSVLERQAPFHDQPCWMNPRYQVVSMPSHQDDSTTVPATVHGVNTSQTLTYSWLRHNGRPMGAGKSIVNIAQLAKTDIPHKVPSVHKVLPGEWCPPNPSEQSVRPVPALHILHYLGTFDQFNYREDPRNAVQSRLDQWHVRGRKPTPRTTDTRLTHWLPALAQQVGAMEMARLLRNVGVLEPKPDASTIAARLEIAGGKAALSGAGDVAAMHSKYADGENGFGACLLIKDDNHWLIEWLAYHYHQGLRELVMQIDPSSITSPHLVLERWKHRIVMDTTTDHETIPQWVRQDFARGKVTDAVYHRYRQQFLYAHCLRHFAVSRRKWVLFSDVDEFVRPNTYALSSPNSTITAPPMHQPNAVLRVLQQVEAQDRPDMRCLHIPRLQMAAMEVNEANQSRVVSSRVPVGLSGQDFLTTRWLYHGGREFRMQGASNLDGKNVINVARLPRHLKLPKKAENVHWIIPGVCPETNGDRLHDPSSPLLIQHYLGTYEQYSFRNDPRDNIEGRPPRRNRDTWLHSGSVMAAQQQGNNATNVTDPAAAAAILPPAPLMTREQLTLDDAMRPWLSGFCAHMGLDECHYLLEGVGQVSDEPKWRAIDRPPPADVIGRSGGVG